MQLSIGQTCLILVFGPWRSISASTITTTIPILQLGCWLPWIYSNVPKSPVWPCRACMSGVAPAMCWSQPSKMAINFLKGNLIHAMLFLLDSLPTTLLLFLWCSIPGLANSPQFHVIFEYWFTSILSLGAVDAFDPFQWQELFAISCFQYFFDDDDPIQPAPEWTTDELYHHNHTLCNDWLTSSCLPQRETTPVPLILLPSIPSMTRVLLSVINSVPSSSRVPSSTPSPVPLVPSSPIPSLLVLSCLNSPLCRDLPSLVQDESSLPLQSVEPLASHPLHMSTHVCRPPQCYDYDGTQGAGYQVSHQAFPSFTAFVHGSNQNQQ